MIRLLPLLILLSACGVDNYVLTISVEKSEIVEQKEPDITADVSVIENESHFTFRCRARWEGRPQDLRAPLDIETEVCVNQKCERTYGGVSEVQVWSLDFEELKDAHYIYCAVVMPEWMTFKGFPPNIVVDEIFPERVILRTITPIKVKKVKEAEGTSYCSEIYYGPDGPECILWE